MAKIKDLINFEKIKDVIDIDAITDKKAMVEKFIISSSLEDYLTHLLQDINASTHKAAQIIGGYGSGKSHLLAFIISLLTEKDLRGYIQNDKVKKAAAALNREFIVIHWELQPNDVSFSEYFYDNLEMQLDEKYGIQITLPDSGVINHKKTILHVLEKIKEGNPTRGLVVVVDEISDFLKGKTKEKITQDVQFMRVLGQAAHNSDFTFIGAMQEHVFSNPRFVDEAESFARVSERFQVITIKREDIKRVISKRVLNKSASQRLQLENLFNDYIKYYPDMRANLDEYIDLFPLHPYVIQIFSELPYFEKRGVIQFTIQEVEKILEEEFPCLITYDRIFDEIASKHTVKNLENVTPVIDAIQTLDSKIDLLDVRHQGEAQRIVKALAVLKLYGKSASNGATVAELANTLLVLPGNKLMEATDELTLILNNFRKVTDGQFISVSKDGYYYLDLTITVDYDQVIKRRAENLAENQLDDEILGILKEQLLLNEGPASSAFYDSCRWTSRRSFREGLFIYEDGKGEKAAGAGDYRIVFLSPFCAANRYQAAENCAVLSSSLAPEAVEILKMAAAARSLARDNYQRSIMEKKYFIFRKQFVDTFIKDCLETGRVTTGESKKSIKSLIIREFTNFGELFDEIKPALFEDYFNNKYKKHPKFTQMITRDNILGEFGAAIKEIIGKSSVKSLFSSSKSILNALNLLDEQGNLATGSSEVASQIVDTAKANNGKNVDVNEISARYKASPYGYDNWMTAFVIVILTYNGEITLKAAGGKVISSSEVGETFGTALNAFESIKYLTIESDFNPLPVIQLMKAIGIDPSLAAKMRVTSKRGEVVQDFRTRYLELKEQIDFAQKKLDVLSLYSSGLIDIDGLKARHDCLSIIPLADFDKVKAPSDFKHVVYDDTTIKAIRDAYSTLQNLHSFYTLYFGQMEKEVEYAKEVKRIVETWPGLFQISGLKDFMDDSFAILADAGRLLDPAERQPLLGKLQQVRKKYVAAYYAAHEKYVGSKVDWQRLKKLADSQACRNLRILKNVAVLNKHLFAKVENEMSVLGRLQCANFRVEMIDKKPLCPHCDFPNGFSNQNIDDRVDALEREIEKILQEWEAGIFTELNNYRDNLPYLAAGDKAAVEQLIKQGKLPAEISEGLVIALNNLFKELVSVEVSPQAIAGALFADSPVMDYLTFERRINDWKQKLVAGQDLSKVRIKLAEDKE